MKNEYQDQANAFLAGTQTKCKITEVDRGSPEWDKMRCYRRRYRCTFTRGEVRRSFSFWASLADGTCTPYDILACLTKYMPDNFEDFCAEFGYDTDSIGANKTYKACIQENAKVLDLWRDSLEQLAEIA